MELFHQTPLPFIEYYVSLATRLSPVTEMGFSLSTLSLVLDEEDIPCSRQYFWEATASILEAKNKKLYLARKGVK